MQSLNRFSPLFVVIVFSLLAPLPLWGYEPPGRSESEQILQDIADLKERISRLEQKIDRLTRRPSEFSPVEIRVVDEQGHPLSGFRVELTASDETQRAQASGVSDDEGMALARQLPYGRYRMEAAGNGWHGDDVVTLEVGKPLERTIVAPTPGRWGQLVLQNRLSSAVLGGLPFGAWRESRNGGVAIAHAPSPSELQDESNGWRTFPTLSDGIDVIGVRLR